MSDANSVPTFASGWQQATRYPDPAIVALDPRFEKYWLKLSCVERLATGCRWAEGPRLGEMLSKLTIFAAQRGAVEPHHERGRAGSALIDRKDVTCHGAQDYQSNPRPGGPTRRATPSVLRSASRSYMCGLRASAGFWVVEASSAARSATP